MKHEVALVLGSTVFTAALAAVDAEKLTDPNDATPAPAAIYEGEKANLDGSGYPVGEVIGHSTVYDTADQQAKSATHEVEIMWTQVGDDELTITRHLERLVRATRDVFWPATGPARLPALASGPIQIISEQYTALMPAKDHPFVKGSATVLRVMTESL